METVSYPRRHGSRLDELWASMACRNPIGEDCLGDHLEDNEGCPASDLSLPTVAPSGFDVLSYENDIQAIGSPNLSGLLLNDILSQASPMAGDASFEHPAQQAFSAPAPPSPPITDAASSIGSPPVTTEFDVASQIDDRPPENPGLRAKRTRRLQAFLDAFRHMPIPSLHAHNAMIAELQDAAAVDVASTVAPSPARLASTLEKLGGDAGGPRAFVYGLLSWEVFRHEEERMGRTARLSSIAASKAANKQMVETLYRRAKTRDWARDGRKAAKVVFDVLQRHGSAERSMALLLLAATVSLDGMLKIAHFPVTRAGFAASFAQIVESKAELWRSLALQGYRTFDYEQLLRSKGAALGRVGEA